MKRVLLSWSSGKDSAWTLYRLRQDPELEVVGLLTTFNSAFERVAMHAVRHSIVEAQAQAASLHLWPVELPWPCSNSEYERCMRGAIAKARAERIEAIAFGDLFLEEGRAYREHQLEGAGLQPLFPLWHLPTADLAHEMLARGLKALLTCVDPRLLPAHFVGREFDAALLAELPAGVDPCGENGEFHTCVYSGPMFSHEIAMDVGQVLERDGFVFADLVLRQAAH